MNNVLLWFGGFLVVLLCALFGVPHLVDWTRYRGVFEEEASRVLGRELRVAGAVNLRLLPTPYVRFEKVRLSDAVGQTGEPFFRADDFTLWLAPGPLLRGAIEAREIELRRPTLKLRLNAQGGGNWQTLTIARGALPFVPSDVALQSVRITDGTVSVDGADGRELARLGSVTGELAMTALEGPYRFKGAIDWSGTRYDAKISTTAFDNDGGLRLKAQVAKPSSNNSVTLDGRLSELSGKVKLDGQLSGQFAFDPSMLGHSSTAPAAAAVAAGAGGKALPMEVRAVIAADAGGARMTDISLAYERDGKPQLVAGTADVGWQGDLTVKSEFSARWIDLDQLLADQNGGKPLQALQRLGGVIGQLVPQGSRGQSIVAVDQITLGGEALSDVRLQVERDESALRVADFRVNVPGGTRLMLSGALPGGDSFDGDVNLRGANLARMLAWLGLSAAVGEARTEGAFSLKSKLTFDPNSVALREASAGLGGAVLTGGVSYRWVGRPRLDVVLDGDQIDLGLISPKALDMLAHARHLTGGEPSRGPAKPDATASAPRPANYVLDPRRQDATLRIRAGRLMDADRDLRDVDVDAAVVNGALSLKRIHFLSGTGLELDAEGDIADIAVRPRGALRGTIGVGDEAAIAELLELFDQPEDGVVFKRLRPVAPARVGWTAKFGDGKDREPASASVSTPAEVWLDGALLGRRLTASARLDGGLRGWATSNLTINAAVERPDWQRLGALLSLDVAGQSAKSGASIAGPSRSRLQIKASGRPDQALSTYLKLEDEAFDAGVSGRITVVDGAIGGADGELLLRTSDAAQALAALGIKARNIPGVAIEGAAELAFKGEQLRISPSALEVAGAVVGGEFTVARVKDGDRQRIEGRLTTSHASIPRLLDLLVDPGSGSTVDSGQPWSSAAFDFSNLDRFEGRLRLEAADLVVTSDVGLSRGVIDADFGPGRIAVGALEGDLLGGRLSSQWRLDKAPAGANLTGNFTVADAKLQQLSPPQGRISGTAGVSGAVSGRGLAPRSLLSGLTGKGELAIAKGDVSVITPAQMRGLGDEVITGKREPTVEAMEKAVMSLLAGAAAQSRLVLGDRKIGFDIGDGAARVRPFTIESVEGLVTNRTTLDLASLMLDSEWKIEQAAPKTSASVSGKALAPPPPVTVVFVGPAAALGRLDPVVSVDALVRELAVRRMERDVEELERLRRLDEERAKAEAERRRAEETARAAAAAAAATTAPVPTPLVPGVAGPVPVASTPEPAAAPAAAASELPASAAAVTPSVPAGADPPGAPVGVEGKRKSQSASEPRQVPSSQSFKNSKAQDVFRKQEFGGR